MSTERDTTRVVRSWLEEGVTRLPDRVLDSVLDQVPATPQRRPWWPAWRSNRMNTYAKLIAAAAAVLVLVVGFLGYQLLPGIGGPGQPSVAPSPSPSLLARGTFTADGREVELDAVGTGDGVTGTLSASVPTDPSSFTLDLQCTLTTEGGVILIGGNVTGSTTHYAPVDTWAALILQRGSPVRSNVWFQLDDPRAASCPAFLEQIVALSADEGWETALKPIEGTVELGL